jgi:hypothetical protein
MWKLRDDCKEGIFLCEDFKEYHGKDIFTICRKCLRADLNGYNFTNNGVSASA